MPVCRLCGHLADAPPPALLDFATSDQILHHGIFQLAAFTEAAYVAIKPDAFATSLTRLSNMEGGDGGGGGGAKGSGRVGAIDGAGVTGLGLQSSKDPSRTQRRSPSRHSHNSLRTRRSQSLRPNGRMLASHLPSSAASSIAESDKSLTSFPTFASPTSPDHEQATPSISEDHVLSTSPCKDSNAAPSIVDSLMESTESNDKPIFEDVVDAASSVPGALHLAGDEHIRRLLARTGPVKLVRQLAGDLAQRDTQMAALRRRAETRERALRRIILEAGLSNLDLEKRLRDLEDNAKHDEEMRKASGGHAPLEDLIHTAMSDEVATASDDRNRTVRPPNAATMQIDSTATKSSGKGWATLIWGGTGKSSSRRSSMSKVTNKDANTIIASKQAKRVSVMEDNLFHPPENGSTSTPSRSSSIASPRPPPLHRQISSSFTSSLVKLVAGGSKNDPPTSPARGRANSNAIRAADRAPSFASTRTSSSARSAQSSQEMPIRRKTIAIPSMPPSRLAQERWDTMAASPSYSSSTTLENYGPVEMDAILDPRTQPPTVTQAYNSNRWSPEFLTDRFGFIYDQRRKKRQKQAMDSMQNKGANRKEMLRAARAGEALENEDLDEYADPGSDIPISFEDDDRPIKKWQDYLKIATFPTELLSHTPSSNMPTMEVMEGTSSPASPGITTEQRGFLPAATTTTSLSGNTSEALKVPTSIADHSLASEDVEPVKLLLAQLGDVHDSLQREKTLRWNDFLRKVRAERRREGEAAAAAMATAAETRQQRAMASMPEASLTDGELVGVANLGIKGRIGKAKWAEFKSLVLSGIPVALRAKIWAECSGATAMRIPGYYDDLVAARTGTDDPTIVAQINMDIHRTLTDNIFFRRGPGVAKLTEVLLAYSRRNIEVGYCQGMNLIAACLLLIMPTAEDAFWVLCSIIEAILPRGYYDDSLLASRADQQVLRAYVTEIFPKLSAHLDNLSIELEALTFQWFLSVFTDCLSAEALFRVWDVVLCINDGSTFLFQVALALLRLNEAQLLKCDSPAAIYTYINHQMTNHAISIDGLIGASEGLRKVVKREDVESRRAKAIESEQQAVREREERIAERKRSRAAIITESLDPASRVGTPTAQHGGDGGLQGINAPPGAGTAHPRGEEGLSTSSLQDEPVFEARRPSQTELCADEYGELTVRTPMPMEEEAVLGLG